MIQNKYTILEKINQGSFGKIYKGKNKYTEDEVILKIETNNYNTLKNELNIYIYINNSEFFPKIKDFYIIDNKNILILEKLDYNLIYYKNNIYNGNISIIYNIYNKIIDIIEFLHSKFIIHRDIKPSNIMLKNNNIKLIDLGFAKSILYDDNHMPKKTISNIIGTPKYISLNIHNLIEPSRRDDIISILYLTLELVIDLPWTNQTTDEMKNMKEKIITFKHDNNFINFLLKLIKINNNLDFNEKPNYSDLKYINN